MSNDSTRTSSPAQAVWFDISSRHPQRTQDFYRDLFGWSISPLDGEDYAMVSAGDGPPSGGIGHATEGAPYVGLVPYFPVDDIQAALDRAAELGATVVMQPAPTPMGRIAAIRDLDGNTVGLQGP
ncbi:MULTISPECIES: VOC family protein [unclassified Isoptericola]|uniref:VOC family protein n=1 Tax=unclassified Isoptericola TaxID=2623355 RepID=UPI0027122F97|nr:MULTISPECIES: VOC family protein [unclassified Isoptericola]MDO8143846.1 VOC family protein [Isoptericola sp. 178]MDO8147741.1 VOC family protein [Isoptericola sp. b515]